jgi:hypothetical protein
MKLSSPADEAPHDRLTTALGFAVCALAIGYAINVNDGRYDPSAMNGLTLGVLAALLGILWPARGRAESFSGKCLPVLLAVGIVLQTGLLLQQELDPKSPPLRLGIVFLGFLGVAQVFDLRAARKPLMGVMVVGFLLILFIKIHQGTVGIDVMLFLRRGSVALAKGMDPYAVQYQNVYPANTPFYGPGVVDSTGKWLTYGFPYPPLTLFMSFVGWLGGDVRYAHVVGAAASAGLIFAARPGRISALAASLFMLTPRGLFVPFIGWTEPLLALNFSLAMFCAVRWRKMLPYALGFFFATKQYTVLSVPALMLLVGRENQWRDLWQMVLRAGIVAAAVTLPLFLWNPHEFVRAVVLWQLVQPFRPDALSYLVSLYQLNGGHVPPICTPFVVVIPIIILALRRFPRTPAGFAGAVTLTNLAFFAFNKQAFCNYYYFVILTACWALGELGVARILQQTPKFSGTRVAKNI